MDNAYLEYYSSIDHYIKNLITKDSMGGLQIQTNTSCNMSCSYCYQRSTSCGYSINDKNIDLLIEKIKAFFKEREKNGNNTYTKISFIGGEISINKNIIEIYKRIKELNIKERIIFQLITNGYYFNNSFKNFLKEISVEKDLYITVSLDLKEMHNKYRLSHDKKTYDEVLENIKYIHSLGISVRRNIVFTKEYFNLKPEDVFNKINENSDYFDEIFIIYEDDLNNHKLCEQEKNFLNEFYNLIENELLFCIKNKKKFKIATTGFCIESYIYGLVYINRNFCTANENTLSISPEADNSLTENICSRYTSFYKNNKGIQLMMKNNPSHKIVKDIMNSSECFNCNLKPFCRQVCFYLNFDDLSCIEFKRFLAEKHKFLLRKIAKEKDFYKSFTEYLKKFDNEGAYESYIKSKEFWKIRYKEVLEVDVEVD